MRKLLPRRAAGGIAAGVTLVTTVWMTTAGADPDPTRAAAFSLLAVGDTGDRHALPSLREGQRAVARGMWAEHEADPVDALLLLGDLFYPSGLARDALVERVRENLVRPYCGFVSLEGSRSPQVASACERAAAGLSIFAVLGNHDHETPGSAELVRARVREFVSNWTIPPGLVGSYELAPGLSLVLFDAPSIAAGADPAPVRDAVRNARGPWRILASHLPIAAAGGATIGEWGREFAPVEALSVPEAPVHLYLSGHRHNLQVIEGRAPGPALHVVAGSGSTIHPLKTPYEDRRFALEQTGFARVDLIGDGAAQRLRVSLFATPRYPIVFWRDRELVERWTVDREGGVRREPRPGDQSLGRPKSSASALSRVQSR